MNYWHKHKLKETRSIIFESAFCLVNVFGCKNDKVAVEHNSGGPKNVLEVIQVRYVKLFVEAYIVKFVAFNNRRSYSIAQNIQYQVKSMEFKVKKLQPFKT